MKMTAKDYLPLVLVSAADFASGRKFICDLIEEEEDGTDEEGDEFERIWSIENKYYSADVMVRLRLDGRPAPPGPPRPPAAHLVLLAPAECADGSWLRARAGVAVAAGVVSDAVLVASPACGARAAAGVADEARALRYELVPLMVDPDDENDDEEEGEERGMVRVRTALHAHTWSSLRRSGGVAAGAAGAPGGASAVERAEMFAELLGQLGAGGAGGAAGRGQGVHEERLARAEQLVAAFCRALDTDEEDPAE